VSCRIHISATFTAEPVQAPLQFLCDSAGLAVETGFAQYNQVFQQFLYPGSESGRNAAGVNVVLVRLEDWTGSAGHQWRPGDGADAARRIVSTAGEFLAALQEACERSPVPHIVLLCAESQVTSTSEEFRKASLEAAELFHGAIARIRGAHCLGPTDILRLYPAGQYDDPASNRRGHIPYTPEYYAALALTIARRVYSLRAAPRKVIVLDCDNTLWTGVAGGMSHGRGDRRAAALPAGVHAGPRPAGVHSVPVQQKCRSRCKPEPQKIPSPQIQPGQERV